jgi:predicted nucleic acid-binding protein
MDGRDPAGALSFITERSFVLPLTQDIALRAADVKHSDGLHTVDAIIYATGLQKGAEVVTGDQHFRGLPNVEMI